jgi:hypothetical protein
MAYAFTAVSGQTAGEFAVSIYDQVNSNFIEVKYADLMWRKVLKKGQIKTDVSAGAQNYVQPIRDMVGSAAFMGKGATPANIPRVGLSVGALTIPLAWSATSAGITNEDVRVYNQGNLGSLPSDLGKAMNKACENLIETSVIFGAPEVGFESFMSYTGVTATTAAATGTGSATTWASKTAQLMADDVNLALTKVMSDSNWIFFPNTVFLPPEQFNRLATTALSIGGAVVAQSALEWLKKNNAYTAQTGNELTIESLRYLKGSGAGGTNRMVVQDVNAEYQYMPFPLPYTMGQPVPTGLGADFYAEQKFGSYAILQKGTTLYVDGI